jgi:hypothetical protein
MRTADHVGEFGWRQGDINRGIQVFKDSSIFILN